MHATRYLGLVGIGAILASASPTATADGMVLMDDVDELYDATVRFVMCSFWVVNDVVRIVGEVSATVGNAVAYAKCLAAAAVGSAYNTAYGAVHQCAPWHPEYWCGKLIDDLVPHPF